VTAEDQAFSAVRKLDPFHGVDAFDCGKEPLNRFLQRHALVNQKAGSVHTYVVCREGQRVVGYYSLAVGAVEHGGAPGRVGKGLARHPIPVMLLARLAIDRSEQGKGLDKALLNGERKVDILHSSGGHAKFQALRDTPPNPDGRLRKRLEAMPPWE